MNNNQHNQRLARGNWNCFNYRNYMVEGDSDYLQINDFHTLRRYMDLIPRAGRLIEEL